MSCSWDIYCLTCKARHGLDANHGVEFIRTAIKYADTIAALEGFADLELKTWAGYLSPPWLAAHASHQLVPQNEYGELDSECGVRVRCSECGADHHCTLSRGHDATVQPHKFERRP